MDFLGIVTAGGSILAIFISAFVFWKSETSKVLKAELEAWKGRSERVEGENKKLFADNAFYKKKIEEIEQRLKKYEEIFQGRDPATVGAFEQFGAMIKEFSDIFRKHDERDKTELKTISEHLKNVTASMENIAALLQPQAVPA